MKINDFNIEKTIKEIKQNKYTSEAATYCILTE